MINRLRRVTVLWRVLVISCVVVGFASACSAGSSPLPVPTASQTSAAPRELMMPRGVSAAVMVYDRQKGQVTEQYNVDQGFRSASLVKLFIALDVLDSFGPNYSIPQADRDRLSLMLRRSDDDAASHYYYNFYPAGKGKTAIVDRVAKRLGLKDTHHNDHYSGWGSTQVSARDILRTYQYILDEAPVPVRDFIMSNLHRSAHCGTDNYNQSFGIPSAFDGQVWAAKQAWSWYDFPKPPQTDSCGAAPTWREEAKQPTTGELEPVAKAAAGPTNWTDEVLHSTGTVGPNDRTIVVVLTVSPHHYPYVQAAENISRLTAQLRLLA